MNHAFSVLLTLCASPAWAFELEVSSLKQGELVEIRATSATPHAMVRVLRSALDPASGPGACPPALGGACLGLRSPETLALVRANASGVARIVREVPVGVPIGDVWFQAIEHGPPARQSNVVARRVRRICAGTQGAGDLAGLEALDYCWRVDGDLSLSGLPVVSLDLPGLQEVRGNFTIARNDLLVGLDGLGSLRRVEGMLYIAGNTNLEQVDGLSELTDLGHLQVAHQPNLTSLAGLLNGVRTLGDLILTDLPVLADLTAPNGWIVSGRLKLTNLPGLTTVQPFSNTLELQGLRLSNLPQLTSLDGLDQIAAIYGELELDNLPLLDDLTPLAGVQSLGGLVVRDLPLLTDFSSLAGASFPIDAERVVLADLPALTTLSHLSGLFAGVKSVQDLVVEDLPQVVTLAGLELDGFVASELRVANNDQLLDVTALQNVSGADVLRMANLPSVQSLDGLQGLEEALAVELSDLAQVTSLGPVGDLSFLFSLWIEHMPLLTDASLFSHLEHVRATVRVEDCPSLADLSFLSSLDLVEGSLTLSELPGLLDLADLGGLTEVRGVVEITYNDQLCATEAAAFAARVSPLPSIVSDNFGVCP
jgi:hypothetical protein